MMLLTDFYSSSRLFVYRMRVAMTTKFLNRQPFRRWITACRYGIIPCSATFATQNYFFRHFLTLNACALLFECDMALLMAIAGQIFNIQTPTTIHILFQHFLIVLLKSNILPATCQYDGKSSLAGGAHFHIALQFPLDALQSVIDRFHLPVQFVRNLLIRLAVQVKGQHLLFQST